MIWVDIVINGILLGGLYGVFGLGLSLVFGVMRVINVAHGEFIVIGAFLGFYLLGLAPGVYPMLIMIPVVIGCFALGYLLQKSLLNRVVESPDPLVPMLVTFGISVIVRNAMLELFGADVRGIDTHGLAQMSVQILSLHLGVLPLITLAISIVLFGGLQIVLKQTAFGRIVRATADNPEIARLMGVKSRRIYSLVMGTAFALAGIAGLLMAMRTSFFPGSGIDRILISFEVVVLGGLGSFWGSLLAGIALGIAQLIGLHYDADAGLLYAHVLFLAFLIARPSGLFGARA